jgi:small subunit ribosomal protein S8
MPQDLISNTMNCLMNAKRAKKNKIAVPCSKFLINVLEVIKNNGYINNFEKKDNKIIIELGEFNECKSIRPRYYVKKDAFEKFIRRFLPSRNFGIIIVATSKGLMTQKEAIEQQIGGSLIAYIF